MQKNSITRTRGARLKFHERATIIPFPSPMQRQQMKKRTPKPSTLESLLDSEDKLEPVDLNLLLIPNPDETYFIRVRGTGLSSAKIFDGDLCIMDCLTEFEDGDVVLAQVGRDMVLRKLKIKRGKFLLVSEYSPTSPIEIQREHIYGKILHTIHSLKENKQTH